MTGFVFHKSLSHLKQSKTAFIHCQQLVMMCEGQHVINIYIVGIVCLFLMRVFVLVC